MTSENEVVGQRADNVSEMAATACNNVLSALHIMAQDSSNRDALSRIHHLGAYTRKIEENLCAGQKAHASGDIQGADFEWANALVLMDAVSIEAENICDNELVRQAIDLQKSGKTA